MSVFIANNSLVLSLSVFHPNHVQMFAIMIKDVIHQTRLMARLSNPRTATRVGMKRRKSQTTDVTIFTDPNREKRGQSARTEPGQRLDLNVKVGYTNNCIHCSVKPAGYYTKTLVFSNKIYKANCFCVSPQKFNIVVFRTKSILTPPCDYYQIKTIFSLRLFFLIFFNLGKKKRPAMNTKLIFFYVLLTQNHPQIIFSYKSKDISFRNRNVYNHTTYPASNK